MKNVGTLLIQNKRQTIHLALAQLACKQGLPTLIKEKFTIDGHKQSFLSRLYGTSPLTSTAESTAPRATRIAARPARARHGGR